MIGRAVAVALALVMAGCSAPNTAVSEQQDDAACRSYMRNKKPTDPGTYEDCRRTLAHIATMPGPGPAPQTATPPTSCFSVPLPGGMVSTSCN